ncbi:hypothetical protein AKJ16_DCAP13673 [Drosera capensis]
MSSVSIMELLMSTLGSCLSATDMVLVQFAVFLPVLFPMADRTYQEFSTEFALQESKLERERDDSDQNFEELMRDWDSTSSTSGSRKSHQGNPEGFRGV